MNLYLAFDGIRCERRGANSNTFYLHHLCTKLHNCTPCESSLFSRKRNEQIEFDSQSMALHTLNNTHIETTTKKMGRKKRENTHTEKSNWECMYRTNKTMLYFIIQ